MAMATTGPTAELMPKSRNWNSHWAAKTAPMKPPVMMTTGTDLAPMKSICRTSRPKRIG